MKKLYMEVRLCGSFKRTVRHSTACGFQYKFILECENLPTSLAGGNFPNCRDFVKL